MIARTYCLEYGLSSIGLRYFSVYGPNEKHKGRFANNISQFIWEIAERRKSPLIYGDGSQTRDFTFVEDVVHANTLAMRKKQQKRSADNIDDRGYELPEYSIYNVGTGIEASFNGVVDLINKQLGSNIMPTYVENPINNYVRHTMADISLARSELGYEPKWPDVENGIKQLLSLQQSANPSSSSGSSYPSIRI
jgi:UDP-glucose 4-epimerase